MIAARPPRRRSRYDSGPPLVYHFKPALWRILGRKDTAGGYDRNKVRSYVKYDVVDTVCYLDDLWSIYPSLIVYKGSAESQLFNNVSALQ